MECRDFKRISNPDGAIAAWRTIGDGQFIKFDAQTIQDYGRTTGTLSCRPVAVLYPQSTSQVQAAMRVAVQFGVGVHPISRGKNWGYGDACPPRPNHAILDLRRMNRILEVNEELCYAVIEPGVTQGQLYDHLARNHPGLWMDASGAGRGASIVGNILERGFGHTRYGDHSLTTCGMQIVLSDGRILETGLGHYANAKAARAYRYGAGPFLDGLFTQSNLGVVTQVGLWLMPKPEAFAAFFVSAPCADDLGPLVTRLAALKVQGLLQSTVHIGNDLRVISGRMGYPWARAGDQIPLPPTLRERLRHELDLGAWNVAGALTGTSKTVAALRRDVRRHLRPFNVVFLGDRKLALARKATAFLSNFGLGRRMTQRLEAVAPVYGLLKGIPTDEPLRGASWRVRDAHPHPPRDPLDCHAGLLWVSPVLPATGTCASEVTRIVEAVLQKHRFDPCMTFSFIADRALICVANISFDRRRPDEAAAARTAYDELTDALMKAGYVPYRCAPEGMSKLVDPEDVFWSVAGQVKRALDPHGVISAGRYESHPCASGDSKSAA